MSDLDDIPTGPVVPGLSQDRTRQGVLAVFVATTLALIWPVYPAVSGIRPYVLGLPFSFAWVVGWLVVMFGALVVLYRHDTGSDD
ncbi:MAG: hypothetical protein ACLFTE_08235 [Salinivenus sp.]